MNSSKLVLMTALLSILFAFCLFYVLTPLPIPGAQDTLPGAEIIHLGGAVGPESLAFDPNGEGPYTGVADGRILKWQGGDHGWTEFAITSSVERKECARPLALEMEHICGRPLGLRFHKKTGDLYIANAYFGLQKVGPNGGLATELVVQAEGQPFRFTNDLDIHEDEGVIYFTDTSTAFQRREFMSSVLTGDKSGRLMKYNIATKEIKVLMRGLAFPNGVALNKDNSFVLIAEASRARVLRYWLKGSKAGTWDVFVDIPGIPDNIRRNPKGDFWVALHSKKGLAGNWFLSSNTHWLGKMLLKLPLSSKQLHLLLVGGKAHACIVKLSKEGEIMEVLEDRDGKSLRFASEVEERNGELWIGSVLMPFIGKHKLVR